MSNQVEAHGSSLWQGYFYLEAYTATYIMETQRSHSVSQQRRMKRISRGGGLARMRGRPSAAEE